LTGQALPARGHKAAGAKAAVAVRRGGRPSKAAAELLVDRIVDAASEQFFALGYGATTIEAVARRARVSKRTLYHRFEDKSALFGAVIRRTIERLRPPADVPLLHGADLSEMLHGLADLILRAALSAPAIQLHRLIIAESSRFPDLATAVNNQGASEEAVRLIAGLLEREARAGNLRLDNPTFAAEQFLHMLVAGPQRRALGLGPPLSSEALDAWVRDVVNLFLNGCRGWDRSATR
jgi:TetR/AcrR family transcriptional regulator, mexJK operon transcriptional repressor